MSWDKWKKQNETFFKHEVTDHKTLRLMQKAFFAGKRESKTQLERAEGVIAFYGDSMSWRDADVDRNKVGYEVIADEDLESLRYEDFDKAICEANFGGKLAREYQAEKERG